MTADDPRPVGEALPTGAELIAAERRRQVEAEGWTPEHDAEDGHAHDLMRAGQAYMRGDVGLWPWHDGWKPKGAFRNLIRAGALFQAALDTGSVVAMAGNAEGFRNVCARMVEELRDEVFDAHVTTRPAASGGATDGERETRPPLTCNAHGTTGCALCFSSDPRLRGAEGCRRDGDRQVPVPDVVGSRTERRREGRDHSRGLPMTAPTPAVPDLLTRLERLHGRGFHFPACMTCRLVSALRAVAELAEQRYRAAWAVWEETIDEHDEPTVESRIAWARMNQALEDMGATCAVLAAALDLAHEAFKEPEDDEEEDLAALQDECEHDWKPRGFNVNYGTIYECEKCGGVTP